MADDEESLRSRLDPGEILRCAQNDGWQLLAGAVSARKDWEALMQLDFTKLDGLVPAIVQDAASGEVLMLGFMNEEAYKETHASGLVTFFSRTRNKLWRKGEQSGHVLKVRELLIDCDADSVLIRAEAVGPGVCHEGYRSCFFRRLSADGSAEIVSPRMFDPAAVYSSGRAALRGSAQTREGKKP